MYHGTKGPVGSKQVSALDTVTGHVGQCPRRLLLQRLLYEFVEVTRQLCVIWGGGGSVQDPCQRERRSGRVPL